MSIKVNKIRVDDKGFRKLSSQIEKAGYNLQAGFFEDSVYQDGTAIAYVAAIQNYGAPKAGIPKRPFFDQSISKNKRNWMRYTKNTLMNWLRLKSFNNFDMVALGSQIVGDIRREITSGGFKGNAESTKNKKGSSQPLIDTGKMRQAVKFKLKSKNKGIVG